MHAQTQATPPDRGRWQAWRSRLHAAADWVGVLMFASVFLIFIGKVGMRYFLHDEAAWSDEVSVILFIWIIFWANSFLMTDRDQITFDLVYRILPDRLQRAFALARLLLIGGLFACSLPGSLGYIRFLWREHTPVLNLPLNAVYSCFGIFMVAVVLRAAFGIAGLLGARWRATL